MRIIIIEDEPEIVSTIAQALTSMKYDVDVAYDGDEGLTKLFDYQYDLILLDVMLPARSGFSVLSELRKADITTPVIMLTSREAIEDRVRGLDTGADDYLTKPFSMDELMARVRSILRRAGDNRSSIFSVKEVEVDTRSRTAHFQGIPLELTPKEFSILEFLLYNKNRAVSRFSLAEHVWGEEYDLFAMSNFIDVHIKNLRKKINDSDRQIIKTVRGVGFTIAE